MHLLMYTYQSSRAAHSNVFSDRPDQLERSLTSTSSNIHVFDTLFPSYGAPHVSGRLPPSPFKILPIRTCCSVHARFERVPVRTSPVRTSPVRTSPVRASLVRASQFEHCWFEHPLPPAACPTRMMYDSNSNLSARAPFAARRHKPRHVTLSALLRIQLPRSNTITLFYSRPCSNNVDIPIRFKHAPLGGPKFEL